MLSKYIPPLSYWFAVAPMPLQGWQFILPLLVFILTFVVGLVLKVWATKTDNFAWRTAFLKFGLIGWTMGAIGLLLIFFEYERTPVLRMRILFLLWALITMGWVGYVWRYLQKTIPNKLKQIRELQAKQKYFPKKN